MIMRKNTNGFNSKRVIFSGSEQAAFGSKLSGYETIIFRPILVARTTIGWKKTAEFNYFEPVALDNPTLLSRSKIEKKKANWKKGRLTAQSLSKAIRSQ